MELCLITCNIRFDNPADGANAWAHRRIFLAETILKYQPHLISTQEGRFDQLEDLRSLLQHYQISDEHRSWIGERMYPSIFLRDQAFEFLSSGDIWLSETPEIAGSRSFESAFPRLMTWSHIQLKDSDKKILVVNTHLDHVKQDTRIGQIKVLIAEIKKVWEPQSALIIMGDFNDSPDSQVRELIFQNFPQLKDAWKLFHTHEETSHHAFMGEIQNGSRIDWILIDEKLTVVDCRMDKSVKDGVYPTDHFPIVCRIKL
jgi:endonuclease/exonuclease/phosphatase family metal-dependent hydrolase